MGVAADGGERFDIVRIRFQHRLLFTHGVQHLAGFFQEDGEQLSVDFFVRRLGQLLGFSGRLGNFRFLRLEGGEGGVDLFRPHIAGLQGFECGLGTLPKLMVGNQVGILLDGLEVLLEFFLQALVLRRFLESLDQRLGVARLAGQFAFDAECWLGRGQLIFMCGFDALPLQAGDKGVKISFAARQGIDEETQGRQLIGDFFEGFRLVGSVGLGQLMDAFNAGVNAGYGAEMPEHGEGTRRLLQRAVKHRKVMFAGRFAEIGVKDLLDLGQVVLDFPGHLADQQFFLGPAGHLVKQGHRGIGGGLAGNAGIQTGDHVIHLLREIGAQALETFLGVLQQQDGGRHLHGHRIAKAGGILDQPVDDGRQPLPQSLEVGLADFLGHCSNATDLLGERRQGRRTTGRADAVPLFLDAGQSLAQATQHGILRQHAGHRLAHRQLLSQSEGCFNLRHHPTRIGTSLGNVVKSLAHQALGQAA